MSQTERRAHPRRHFDTTVHLRCGDQEGECRARDLGFGGIFLFLDPLPAIREEVLLQLPLGDNGPPIEIRGMVTRHDEAIGGAGVVFMQMSPAAAERLRALLLGLDPS